MAKVTSWDASVEDQGILQIPKSKVSEKICTQVAVVGPCSVVTYVTQCHR